MMIGERPTKTAQTFFVLDADTGQPVCFTTGTSARTAAAAAEELLKLAGDILGTEPGQTLVLADSEHFTRRAFGQGQDRDEFRPSGTHAQSTRPARQIDGLPPETVPSRGGPAMRPRSWHTPPRTARLDRSTNTFSGRGSGRRSTASTHSSRPAMATRLRSWPGIFPSAGMWRSSSMRIRHWAGTGRGRAISTFATAR